MADNKLRCCVVLRLEKGSSTVVAKYDHAGLTESHSGAGSLYGGKDKNFAEAIQEAVAKDAPSNLSGGFGGFKVVQSDAHQLVYGADKAGCCKFVLVSIDSEQETKSFRAPRRIWIFRRHVVGIL